MTAPASPSAQSRSEATQPDLPRWTRILTHVTALGWATWEIGWGGARLSSFLFIAAVLLGSVGLEALLKVRGLLR